MATITTRRTPESDGEATKLCRRVDHRRVFTQLIMGIKRWLRQETAVARPITKSRKIRPALNGTAPLSQISGIASGKPTKWIKPITTMMARLSSAQGASLSRHGPVIGAISDGESYQLILGLIEHRDNQQWQWCLNYTRDRSFCHRRWYW